MFKIYRCPLYLNYFWDRYVIPNLVKRKGVRFGNQVNFIGYPIISMAPHSKIEIGSAALLCSLSRSTALGVNHSIIMRTLKEGAIIKIGDGVRMSGTTICAAERIIIGNNVCIGANVTITDTDFHSLNPELRKSEIDAKKANVSPIEIEDDVFIGTGALILKGVKISRGTVIGAGSVVTKSYPEFSIIAGNPARPIGKVSL